MASQRVTLAKIGGASADHVWRLFGEWAATRNTDDPNTWSPEQWPASIRQTADHFGDQLREHGLAPPIMHFVEWADLWSMGDQFSCWLTPSDGPLPYLVHADRYELLTYKLPDGGRLSEFLRSAGKQQWDETNLLIRRIREAIVAWRKLVESAVIVLLRRVVDGSVSDEQVIESMKRVQKWLL